MPQLLSPLERRLAPWIRDRERSLLRQMISVVSRPGILSLAGGLPAAELFPTDDYAASLAEVLRDDPGALQYGPPSRALVHQVVRLLARRGVEVSTDEILLTTGAQQALDIATRLLLEPGGDLILEETVYPGLEQVLGPFAPRIHRVPIDPGTGVEVEAIAALLRSGVRPAYLYVIPDGHNPRGVSLSPAKRRALVELAREYEVPLLEDDPYGLLSYDGEAAAPLRSIDDQVLYCGSFSKIIAPALRLGWLVLPRELKARATIVKEASDLECSALTQRAVARLLERLSLEEHLGRARQLYGERRDALLRALERELGDRATWTRPEAGFFTWLEFADRSVDTSALLERAIEEESLAFIPGEAFAPPTPQPSSPDASVARARSSLRLSFSTLEPAALEEGVRRLARLLERSSS